MKQAAETRATIVTSLVAELAHAHETGEELSLPRVADRAGVSLRTIYHHFPDRAAQLAAIGMHLDATAPAEPNPTSLGDLPAHAARFAYHALANVTTTRAELLLNRQRRGRDQAIARAVSKQLDPGVARLAAAALSSVLSPELALTLVDRHHLDASSAETTVTWMVQVLVDAIRNGDTPASPLKRTRRS